MRRRHLTWPLAIAMMLGASQAGTYAQQTAAPVTPQPQATMPPAPPAAMPPAGRPQAVPMGNGGPPPPPMQFTPPPPPPKHGPKPVGVAAVVNGIKITDAAVSALAFKQFGAQALNGLIINTLVEQDAKKQHITVSQAEIDVKVNELRSRIMQQAQGQTFEQMLAKNHITLADLQNNMRIRAEAEKIVGKNIATPRMIHVRHILVATTNLGGGTPQTPAHTDAEAKAIIVKAQAELKAGKSFEDVAKAYSEDPTNKDKGGDLGIISANTPFDPAFLQAAMALKTGEITVEPVKSQFGYHLIKVDSSSDNPSVAEKAAYATAAQQMKDQQVGQALQGYIQQLQQKATIVNYLSN